MQIKTETKVGLFVIIAIAIFMMMTLGIGAFRFSSSGYTPYNVSFEDVSGLSKKAEVKISGVKVGWVESISLTETGKAQARIMVNDKYSLYDNAYAVVRQEGLIGTKYLEVSTGDPMLPRVSSGTTLARPGRDAVSIDELLFKFKNIATHVEQVTDSIKEAFTGPEKSEQLKSLVENLSSASSKIERLASSLDNVFVHNEDSMKKTLENVENVTSSLRQDLPELTSQAREGFNNITSISQKIDEGRGLLGKLINEDDLYRDVKSAITGVKNYLNKVDNLTIVLDAHSESMHRPVDNFRFTDSKGYFNARIHTNSTSFYVGQMVTSERGFVSRKYEYNTYADSRESDYNFIPYEDIEKNLESSFLEYNKRNFAPLKITQERKQFAYGFQFGKIFNNLALRVGLFEGAFGVGADYFIPLPNNKLSWITSLEMFDVMGTQRLELNKERRPHLKWINRIFLLNNLYTTFGFDDFVSNNASSFWGIGIRFADDDIKYLLSKVNMGFA